VDWAPGQGAAATGSLGGCGTGMDSGVALFSAIICAVFCGTEAAGVCGGRGSTGLAGEIGAADPDAAARSAFERRARSDFGGVPRTPAVSRSVGEADFRGILLRFVLVGVVGSPVAASTGMPGSAGGGSVGGRDESSGVRLTRPARDGELAVVFAMVALVSDCFFLMP
jgi:hypothetical protein